MLQNINIIHLYTRALHFSKDGLLLYDTYNYMKGNDIHTSLVLSVVIVHILVQKLFLHI